jgi:hypothetical protein
MSTFNQHRPNSILALNLSEETVGETTMFVHLLALLRIMSRHLWQTTSRVRPGSPAEGGKIDGNSIKYEKTKSKIVSVSFFVKSMLVLGTQDVSGRVFVLGVQVRRSLHDLKLILLLGINVKSSSSHRFWRRRKDFLVGRS